MKKNLILFLIFFCISGIVSYILVNKDNNHLSDKQERDFAVKNTDEIDKIFLANKHGQSSLLTKNGDEWIVNNKYNVRKGRINTLLKTIKELKVRNRVAKKAEELVINNLASTHTKIEVFKKDRLVKVYFIGGPDQHTTGTYMLLKDPETLENAEHPFVLYLPGFEGYLTPRYDANPENWRNLSVLNFPENNIVDIELNYPNSPKDGFKIQFIHKEYKLLVNGKYSNFDEEKLKRYILGFKSANAEAFITKKNPQLLDSLSKATPYFTLKLTDDKGKVKEIIGHKRKAKEGEINLAGEPIKLDQDRFYGITFNKEELCILQYYVFDKYLKTNKYFRNSN